MRRMTLPAVLAVHPDAVRLEQLRALLSLGGYRVLTARSAELAFELLSGLQVRCVLAAEDLGQGTGMDLLARVHRRTPHAALVLLGEQPDLENHPHVFGWLPEDCEPAALLGMVQLAVHQALLDTTARRLEMLPLDAATG